MLLYGGHNYTQIHTETQLIINNKKTEAEQKKID